MITLPVVTDDFDGQCAALDAAIKEAAASFKFSYVAPAPRFDEIDRIPEVIYALINHYTARGFICKYDGTEGQLKISWSHPNMSWLEHQRVTRAIPTMIPNLGIGFRASMVYLCMTNNVDLRKHSDITLQREISSGIKKAAALGNTEMYFGFPEVPAPVVSELFKATFDLLLSKGFLIAFDVNQNIFVLKWGQTLDLSINDGGEFTIEDLIIQ